MNSGRAGEVQASPPGLSFVGQGLESPETPPQSRGCKRHVASRMHGLSLSIAVLLALAPVSHAQSSPQPVPPQTNSGTGFAAAPYSARETTVTVRLLSDGRKSKQTSVQLIWRDTDGRTRREIIQHTESGAEYHSIVVTDPVAGVYLKWEVGNPKARQVMSIWPLPRTERAIVPVEFGAPDRAPQDPIVSTPDFLRETLAPQDINGIYAQGTRTTRAVRLEQENGDLFIKVVNELWVSPDLKIIVRHLQDDPRTGSSVTDVTDVVRGDPDPALFQPPEGYEVADHTRRNGQ